MLLFQVEHILSKYWTLVFDGRVSDFQKRDLCWKWHIWPLSKFVANPATMMLVTASDTINVILVTLWCWRFKDVELHHVSMIMLVTFLRCWCPGQHIKLVTNISNLSPTYFPTSVSNNGVANKLGKWYQNDLIRMVKSFRYHFIFSLLIFYLRLVFL